MTYFLGHFSKWFELFITYQTEFAGEVVEVLVAGVDVGFRTDGDDLVEVVDVNVYENSE